jgi:hypothetical protein
MDDCPVCIFTKKVTNRFALLALVNVKNGLLVAAVHVKALSWLAVFWELITVPSVMIGTVTAVARSTAFTRNV